MSLNFKKAYKGNKELYFQSFEFRSKYSVKSQIELYKVYSSDTTYELVKATSAEEALRKSKNQESTKVVYAGVAKRILSPDSIIQKTSNT